ncbi:MAG: serine/threonine-protein phosphatase [Planctomycetota bacterium]|nr:MAG: serine/threonine-protein phosphatase [Planctomycetota bacterium]
MGMEPEAQRRKTFTGNVEHEARCDAGARSPLRIRPLQCMEIVGGSERVDAAFSAPGVDVFLRSRPHGGEHSGGDVHYVSLCGRGCVSRLLVADVSGHGEEVAAIAHRLRRLMRKTIGTPDQRKLARALNREFNSARGEGRIVTAIIATYFAPTDQLILCNAGHPPPLWWSAQTERWSLLRADAHEVQSQGVGPRNLPFGVIEPTEYVQFAVRLTPDDLVVVFTDGVTEARLPEGGRLGQEGLLRLVERVDPRAPERFLDALEEQLDQLGAHPPEDDDATLLLLHHNAADPPEQTLLDRIRVTARMLGLGG